MYGRQRRSYPVEEESRPWNKTPAPIILDYESWRVARLRPRKALCARHDHARSCLSKAASLTALPRTVETTTAIVRVLLFPGWRESLIAAPIGCVEPGKL